MIFYQNFTKNIKIILISVVLSLFSLDSNAKNKYLEENFEVIIRKNDSNLVEKFKDWSIYKVEENNRKYCYALSRPISHTSHLLKRAKPYFIVSDLVYDADEVTVISGFEYKDNSDIEISFGSTKFYLFAYKFKGWAYTKNNDLDIIKEMQKNAEFIITAFSQDNRPVIDRYSLIGFKQAYFKLKEICKK